MDEAYILQETVDAFEECLDDAKTIAVVAAPWSGRSALLDRAAERSGTTERVTLESTVEEPPVVPDSDRVLVDGCHHLYRRRIDGFAPLDQFRRDVATADGTVVTAWNRTAWSYLDAITPIAQVFDEIFEIPPLDSEQALALLGETTGLPDPEAALDEYAEYTATPDTRLEQVRTRVRRFYRGTVVEHIDGLVSDAAGNPRAIHELFECRTDRGVHGCPGEPDVGYDASYLLWLVLSNEGLGVEELASRVEGPVETDLAALTRQRAVTISDGEVTISPQAYGDVYSHLERRRLVW